MPHPPQPPTGAPPEVPATPAPGPAGTTGPATPFLPPTGATAGDVLAPPQAPDEIGRLGEYRILRALGAGGMGVVYEAEDPALLRRVAVKVMRPEVAARPEAKARFLREARAAAALHDDHVVAIHHVGEAGGVPFQVMPLLRGETLTDRLRRGRPPLREAVRIARDVARGLAAAHAAGLVHRDVKPANLWLEAPTGRVKVLDLGLARPVCGDDSITHSGQVLGTWRFMAPEQARGQAVDHRADLFSLGVVLYLLTTGRYPFQGSDLLSHLSSLALDDPPPPRAVDPAVPADLSGLVMRLLAKAADDRPQSAAAVAAELDGLAARAGGPPPAPTRRDRRRAVLGLLVLAGAGLVAAAGLWPAARPNPHGPAAPPADPAPPRHAGIPVALDLGGGVTLEFVHIPAGSFTMGSPPAERDAFERAARKPLTDEGQHPVRISRDFYLGKYPVTQDQYLAVTGTNPSYFSPTGRGKDTVVGRDTGQFPVDSVSWEDAVGFCDRLSRRSGRRVDLPTEAEWEYACRAGTTTVFYFGDSLDGTRANCDGRYPFGTAVPGPFLNRPTPVGAYAAEAPHPWGLCDMHGNVWQWCRDWYDPDYYRRSPAVDPVCSDGDRRSRVLRGGSWDFPAWCCRSAFRLDRQPTAHFIILGFRVALRPE